MTDKMDTSQTDNANTNMGCAGNAAKQPLKIAKQPDTATYTVTKSRSLTHYISNNMIQDRLEVYVDSDGYRSWTYDAGWQYVPYDTCRASWTPKNWWKEIMNAATESKHTT